MLSLPRDLKVTWNGSTTKINAPFNEGAAAMVETVRDYTGFPIHHYMQVDFAGFADIVDAIGGLEMTFPYPARDRKSGFAVDAGTHRLTGKQAIAFARSRTYEENRDGTWVFVDANDFGRTRRQQDLLMTMITQIERPSSIDGVRDILDALGGFVFVDSEFDETEIIQLAWGLRNVGPGDLDAVTLPAQISNEGGVSYVVPVEPAAGEAMAAFAAGRRYQELPDSFTVQVLNGNGRPGAAGTVADALTAAGFDVVGAADSGRSDYSTTLVISRPNLIPLGERVVAQLGFGSTQVGRTPDGVDVVVIVGLDAPQ
jgi:LCP family protein required for cell wall assembly